MSNTLALQKPHRIEVIDAIRGFALMGLFLVHMVEYFELYWYAPQPGWVHDWVFGIFAGKAYALFALMFGVSFYILLEAPKSRASMTQGRYAWRLFLLWVLGYAHSLIYAGDILQVLAVGGILILLLHRLSDRVLMILAAIFLLQIPFFLQYAILLPDETYTQPRFWAASGTNFEVFAHASWFDLIKYNAWQGQFPKWIMNYEVGALWNFLGLFLSGIILARKRLFSDKIPLKNYFIAAVMLALLAFFAVSIRNHYAFTFEPFMHKWVFEQGLNRIYAFCLVGLYILFGIILFRTQVSHQILKPLVACGRMSLSLYILQTIIFVPIFYGFGLGLYESIGQKNALFFGCIAWGLQMVLANVWLSHYRYGPLEALWRRLTFIQARSEA